MIHTQIISRLIDYSINNLENEFDPSEHDLDCFTIQVPSALILLFFLKIITTERKTSALCFKSKKIILRTSLFHAPDRYIMLLSSSFTLCISSVLHDVRSHGVFSFTLSVFPHFLLLSCLAKIKKSLLLPTS